MLESVKISRRQSEIRQALAGLAAKAAPTEDEVRSMETMDSEYRQNETRYRAALIGEDSERREAKGELETRGDRQFADLIGQFELRQVVLALDEGKALTGATAEVVQEMRSKGGFRGVPVPWLALEQRSGETVASGVAGQLETRPIIDRLFPASTAGRMGAQMIGIDVGAVEWPVVTSAVAAGWADGETASVAAAAAFATTEKALAPNNNFGVQMKITRRALKSTAALEAAVRRDMNSAIAAGMDAAVFRGTGANGQPLGIIPGLSTYGIAEDEIDAPATWGAFRSAVTAFIVANAAGGPGSVNALIRPEIWDFLDSQLSGFALGVTGTHASEWDRLPRNIPAGNIVMSSNALAAPAGDPAECIAVLTTNAGGVAPIYVGTWGGIDMIRDPYSDATSGGLRLTALVTMDVTVARPAQLRVISGLQLELEEEGGGE